MANNKEIVVEMSESAGVREPGVHSTPVNWSKEYSLTESAIDLSLIHISVIHQQNKNVN